MFIDNALCFKCYSKPTPTFAGHFFFTQYEWENRKSDDSQFPIFLMVVKTFSASCFSDNGLKSQQGTVQTFWNKIKSSPLTSKATSGYFGQSNWNWIKGNVHKFEKIRPDANNKNFMETAGNRYLRKFLPASAGNFTCETVNLRPVQVNLHAPVLQWTSNLARSNVEPISYQET